MPRKPALHRKGFTLIEALMSAVILGISLVSIGAAFVNGFKFVESVRQQAIATAVAQVKIEEVRTKPFNTILGLAASTTYTSANITQLATLRNATATQTIDDIYSDNNIRRISFSVTWTAPQGHNVTKRLVTLVTREGIDRQ